jgi:ribosomal protein S12 methylthiotransferase accessory factor YcaO
LLDKLRSVGIEEVVCVDLSLAYMPEVSVMRVVIPGLESAVDDHRHVPGTRAQRARAA